MACCGKTCAKVSIGIGLLLALVGVILLVVGMMSARSLTLSFSVDIDGEMSGTLTPTTDSGCGKDFLIFIEKGTDCNDFTAGWTETGGTMDFGSCDATSISELEGGASSRNMEDFDWTIGSEPISNLMQGGLFIADSDTTPATITSTYPVWAMGTCSLIDEVVGAALGALLMLLAGAALLIIGILTCSIGLCCCCCCAKD